MTYQKPEILAALPALKTIQTHIGKNNDAVDNIPLQTRTNDPAYEADE
jgi:hypothetical protein